MNEMVERVAKAMYGGDADVFLTGHNPWDTCAAVIQEAYRREARAAIAAMREPTEAMLKRGAGTRATMQFLNQGISGPIGEWPAMDAWTRMIDAALAELPATDPPA